ncbi:SDR family oxidoreductase [Compostibacter hankyongensis]|uniref:Glucose 1-dehydrogenase n=1 Tax=Compostibacter hankyongensis TaxID=1007089 RepID=A0ABP8FX10_9BACT
MEAIQKAGEGADGTFAGQAAIVTGAGKGIGYEICRQLARRGCAVTLNDIDASLAEQAAENIRREGGNCIAVAGDTADAAFLQEMVQRTVTAFGQVSVLVANAGITLFGDFFAYRPEDFQRVMDVNLKGSFFLTQAVAAEMRRQGSGGRILLMSSVTGHQAHKYLAAYGMSKAALEMLAKSLVVDLSPYKITINTVAPGATLTERTAEDPAYEEIWSRITPMGRPAVPADIAAAVLFLVSPVAAHITGQSLVVDGGWTAISPPPEP